APLPPEDTPPPFLQEAPHIFKTQATQNWAAAVSAVSKASSRYGTALGHARLVQLQPGSVHLAFTPQASFHKNSVFNSGRNVIEKVLSEFFNTPTQLVEDNTPQAYNSAKPSFAEQQEKLRESTTRQLEAKVHAHPKIQATLSILGGHIESIRALEAAPAPLTFFEDEDNDNDND
ncbi:MAG: hypothetical protein FWC28_03980, partial [Proteobacteria bacterium]|nr:hypothetical protein [Pseudomonadota bacterium]